MRPSLLLLAFALLLASATTGCGREASRYRWERHLLDVDRQADHGAWDEAAARYADLQPDAPNDHFKRYIDLRLAWIAEQRGDLPDAVTRYQAIWSDPARDEFTGQALFRAAAILYRDPARQQDALDAWTRLLSALPESPAADKALYAIEDHHRRLPDLPALLAFVEDRYKLLKDTPMGDNLLALRARLLLELDDPQGAEATWHHLLKHHADSTLTDNARWSLADLYAQQQRWDEALTQLRFLTEDQDTSWYVGDYNSSYVDDARYKMGLIFLEDLQRWDDAIEQFTRFYTEFDTSLLRDDARWNVIQAQLGRGDGAAAARTCDALAEAEPESRWVRRCQALQRDLQAGRPPQDLRAPAAR